MAAKLELLPLESMTCKQIKEGTMEDWGKIGGSIEENRGFRDPKTLSESQNEI